MAEFLEFLVEFPVPKYFFVALFSEPSSLTDSGSSERVRFLPDVRGLFVSDLTVVDRSSSGSSARFVSDDLVLSMLRCGTAFLLMELVPFNGGASAGGVGVIDHRKPSGSIC